MPAADAEPPGGHWGAFRHRGFLLFWLSRMLVTFAAQIVSVAIGWQIYDLTRSPFDLGLVGLVQFAPALLLVLVTGTVSDRYNRRRIVAAGWSLDSVELLCSDESYLAPIYETARRLRPPEPQRLAVQPGQTAGTSPAVLLCAIFPLNYRVLIAKKS